MICVKNLNKSYGKRRVLDNISIEFQEGNLYVLKGVSGCGKTTLLNILAGLDKNYEGLVEYNGRAIKNIKNYQDLIGYIFQQSLLLSKLTIFENLKLISHDVEKIYEYSDKFCCRELLSKYPSQCSNGERQRISIIRALLLDCPIILTDEPTAALDMENSQKVAENFKSIQDGNKIIIVATHENCFDDIASHMIEIDYGRIEYSESFNYENNLIYEQKRKIRTSFLKEDLHYANTRRKHTSSMFCISISFILCIILLLLASYFHLKEGFEKYVYQNYPYQTMILTQDQIMDNNIPEGKMMKYENYYDEIDGISFVPWLPKEDSILDSPSMISHGDFPKNDLEILLNEEAIAILFECDKENIIGEKMKLLDNEYQIVGVISEEALSDISKSYPTYQDIMNKPTVFISYKQMEVISVRIDMEKHLYSIPKTEIANSQWNMILNKYSPMNHYVEAKLYSMQNIMEMLVVSIPALLLLAFVFIFNMIYMEMFYRKAEIGYLQIFHISKFRINRMMFLEYLLLTIKPVLVGFFSYIALMLLIFKVTDISFALTMLEIFLILLFIFFYIGLLVICPLFLLLKKPILDLISD